MTCGLVRIRLARFGRKNAPLYNIVVTTKKKARDAKPLEVLGTYNPIPKIITPYERKRGILPTKDVELDFSRAKYWIGVGAQPTETVTKLLKKCGILSEEWGKQYTASPRKIIEERREIIE
ncbi:mitochondrial 37S ribosomal protein bS16m NDAI_0C06180 [Naumovozyma dairenensis CBS 421]|uniref:Ribosomal protein S16 n=1 Tax=Naumovozyma dairenensis (strain ATCC 10597 / BCRC 20456 / CBS 421 / NBRC 0211 / NRRL Y-12639) TaxID=1071378 RepID=G0W916_NAUDC|nr:hypothetical protein NDAI_0C06180 [Naumovozyma dairenensis CBS 421]CCD24277.1 hypothetical protein NDAI_0C06180 [Naumovozyma dairenensis CBS 421]